MALASGNSATGNHTYHTKPKPAPAYPTYPSAGPSYADDLAQHIATQNAVAAAYGIGGPASAAYTPITSPYPLVNLVARWAPRHNVDPAAVLANAMGEGGWGPNYGVGDNGTSFGPFQLHRGGALPEGMGQRWAESKPGIKYALRGIKNVAAGLKGNAAVAAMVRDFERPADIPGQIALRQSYLDEAQKALEGYGLGPVSVTKNWHPFPVFGKGFDDITNMGGVAGHQSRPLGNWQSDNAVDLGVDPGTAVYAPARGHLVGNFGFSSNGSTVWGNRLTLDPNRGGLPDWFMTHLGSFAPGLEAGDAVKRGQLLGYVGDPPAFAPHLHFGQSEGNPEALVNAMYRNTFAGVRPQTVFSAPDIAYKATAPGTGTGSPGGTGGVSGPYGGPLDPFAYGGGIEPGSGRRRRKTVSDSADLISQLIAALQGQSLGASY